jgi:CheY-like chemotaxis protein
MHGGEAGDRQDELADRLLALGVTPEEARGVAGEREVVERLERALSELNGIVRSLLDTTGDGPPPVTSAGLQILVVDDDSDMRLLIARVLESLGSVHCVPDVYQALGWLDSEPVDVMVLDLLLPGASGIELLSRLRRRGRTVPTVVLSGVGGDGIGQMAQEAGAAVVLPKPLQIELLRTTVLEVATGARRATP